MWYVYIAIFVLMCKLYIKATSGICRSNTKLTNKVAIVTGANTGIGFETAKELAKRGAKVILGCRDELKGIIASRLIIQQTGNKDIYYKHLDLASLRSIKTFSEYVYATEDQVHILINNAGTGKLDNSLTEDNLPVEMQINHFGPFQLTNLLLPLLKRSAPSRIIFVSSVMHRYGKIDLKKFHVPAKGFLQHSRVYSNSKLANILTTKYLHRQLFGTGVTVNCLHPGAVNTDIFRNQPSFVRVLIGLLFKSPWEGAQTSIYLAVSPEVEGLSGKYFVDCQETKTSQIAEDEELAKDLWEKTEEILTEHTKNFNKND